MTYEMLAGEPPFTGPTAQAIVAKIVATEPEPLTALRKTVPPHVEDAVLTALEKIPADRFASASAFAAALEGTHAVSGARTGRTRVAAAASRRRRALWPLVATVLALIALWGWLRPRSGATSASEMPPTQLALLLPDFGGASTGLQRQLEITPDGTALLYSALFEGQNRTKRIPLDGSEGRVLEGVQPYLADYIISQDGRTFTAASSEESAIYRYPIGGGTGKPLPRGIAWSQRGAWASDGSFWLNNSSTLDITRVSPTDSVTHPFAGRHGDLTIMQILPGDRTALTLRQPNGTATGPALLLDLRTGDARMLLDEPVVEVRYTAGHLVYVLGDASLQASPFDLGALRVTAPPVTLANNVMLTGGGQAQLSVAANGTVAFAVEAGRSLIVTDRSGASRPLVAEMHNYHHPRFSPDGRRIAVDFNSADGRDVWIVNVADGAMTRATFDRDGHDANWSPDGRNLVYTSFHGGVLGVRRIRIGTADADSLLASSNLGYTGFWLADQRALVTVGQMLRPGSGLDIAIVRNGGRGPIEPLVATRFAEQYPAVSRDGQWLAFSSNQSGREEVYVRRLEGDDEQIQVSVGGGGEPVWSPDGRELIYRGRPNAESRAEPMTMAATITTQPALAVASRKALFPAAAIVTSNPHGNMDVSPDGKSFVYVRSNPSSRVMVIQNLPAMVASRRGAVKGAP
jgi:serine/threonine-protein kinase